MTDKGFSWCFFCFRADGLERLRDPRVEASLEVAEPRAELNGRTKGRTQKKEGCLQGFVNLFYSMPL